MKEIVIISGKGGTGKTSLTAAFTAIAESVIIADCDVDAPDLHLVLRPDIKESFDYFGGKKANILIEKCTACGRCKKLCRFDAVNNHNITNKLKTYSISKINCQGCGVCYEFCPSNAIELVENLSGKWFLSETRFGPMVHALLAPAEENSGKLVAAIKEYARNIGEKEQKQFFLIDGPPGIGCPVIASMAGADLVVIVTEPGISALHDMLRAADLAQHFHISTAICINKSDINPEITDEIIKIAQKRQIPVIGKVPFNQDFLNAQIAQKCLVEFSPQSRAVLELKKIWQNILQLLS